MMKTDEIRMRSPALSKQQTPPLSSVPPSSLSDDHHRHENKKGGNLLFLIILLILSITALIMLFFNLPTLSKEEAKHVKIPRSADDLRALSNILLVYRDQYYWTVVINFCALYMFLQAFAIPGAIFLSILAGPLFGIWRGLFIVSIVATTGAAVCYGMSNYLGRGLVQRCLPQLLNRFRKMIAAQRHNLFYYLLFLRISPLLPNWFISVSSPILNVPLLHFVAATFIGLIPANYLHVNTGMTLSNIESVGGIDMKSVLTLFGIACLALIPTLFKGKFIEYEQRMAASAASLNDNNNNNTTIRIHKHAQ